MFLASCTSLFAPIFLDPDLKNQRFLDAQGLYVPGLFRVPGNTETIRELKARFDGGEHVEFDEDVRLLFVFPARSVQY